MKTKNRTLKLFHHWLKTDHMRLSQSIRINRVTKDTVKFNFVGVSPAIHGEFICGRKLFSAISIWVHWKKYHCDLLLRIRVDIKKTSQGYYCGCCYPDDTVFYQTKDEILINHTFKIFTDWCDSNLSQSEWMNILGVDGHEAIILKDQDIFHKQTNYENRGCMYKLINNIH